jgi:hypothetical protein
MIFHIHLGLPHFPKCNSNSEPGPPTFLRAKKFGTAHPPQRLALGTNLEWLHESNVHIYVLFWQVQVQRPHETRDSQCMRKARHNPTTTHGLLLHHGLLQQTYALTHAHTYRYTLCI